MQKSGKSILGYCKDYSDMSTDALPVGRLALQASKITVNAGVNQINSLISALSNLAKTPTEKVAKTELQTDMVKAE